MSPRSPFGASVGRPALRLLAALPALLLLLPVPALALTFTGSWNAVFTPSGAPTPPAPTFTDATNNAKQSDVLSIDLGNYQNNTGPASSTYELTRGVSVTAPGQSVLFGDFFVAGFQNAGTSETVSVKNASGQTVVQPVQINLNNTSNSLEYFAAFQANLAKLQKGDYTLDVRVKYFTNNKVGGVGGWRSISNYHQFGFQGQ